MLISLFPFTCGDFRYMDYGEKYNIIKYNQTRPPEYNMSQVTAPVALFYGDGDFLIKREVSLYNKNIEINKNYTKQKLFYSRTQNI